VYTAVDKAVDTAATVVHTGRKDSRVHGRNHGRVHGSYAWVNGPCTCERAVLGVFQNDYPFCNIGKRSYAVLESKWRPAIARHSPANRNCDQSCGPVAATFVYIWLWILRCGTATGGLPVVYTQPVVYVFVYIVREAKKKITKVR